MKATIITLAVAVAVAIAAPQALAKTIYESEDTPSTGWDSPGGWMGDADFGGFGDGATEGGSLIFQRSKHGAFE